jgi:mono/diheme cytochrome c family protein
MDHRSRRARELRQPFEADPQASSSTSAAPAATASGPAATSQYDGGPRAADTPIDESKIAHGQQLFQTKGCSACHTFGQKLTGPDLAGVTHRRTAAWMENQILHPEIMTKEDPISHELFAKFALQMPNQGLTPEEAAAVVEFFKHKTTRPPSPPPRGMTHETLDVDHARRSRRVSMARRISPAAPRPPQARARPAPRHSACT